MPMLPLYYYVILGILTLVVLLLKDKIVNKVYHGRRPNRLSASSQYLFGYTAAHWVVTYILFWAIELVWRTYMGRSGTYYGFFLASMEASLRIGSYLYVRVENNRLEPRWLLFLGRYNYLILSVCVPTLIAILTYVHTPY